jgi:hypothetical protein
MRTKFELSEKNEMAIDVAAELAWHAYHLGQRGVKVVSFGGSGCEANNNFYLYAETQDE